MSKVFFTLSLKIKKFVYFHKKKFFGAIKLFAFEVNESCLKIAYKA